MFLPLIVVGETIGLTSTQRCNADCIVLRAPTLTTKALDVTPVVETPEKIVCGRITFIVHVYGDI